MQPVQEQKFVLMTYPQVTNNDDMSNNKAVYTPGWNHLRILFAVGVTDAAVGSTAETNPPLIEECDTEGGQYTAVDDAVLAAVIGAGDDGKLKAIDIDLARTHKAWMRIQAPHAANATGAAFCAIGVLSKPNIGPVTAAEMGLAELVNA